MPAHAKSPEVVASPGDGADAMASTVSALPHCAALIAAEPGIAAALAAIDTPERFVDALIEVMRPRGVVLDAASRTTLLANRYLTQGLRTTQWPLAERDGWQPFALEWGAQGAELVWGCGVPRAHAPFHEETVMALRVRPLNRCFAVRTPLTPEFVAQLEGEALPLAGWVFHMSRCGSTLFAQTLKAWPRLRVLSEPGLLDTGLMLGCAGQDPAWLVFRGVLAALAQPGESHQRVMVKLDAWHALAIVPLLQRRPVPWMFVYRDPVEVLVSHAREPGRHTVPGMLPDAWLGAAAPAPGFDRFVPHDYAARVIGAICAAVVPHASARHLLNYADIPALLVSHACACFDLIAADADVALLQETLAHHAKRPYEAFADDRKPKRDAARPELIAAAERWITPHYGALEQIRSGEASP